MYNTAHFSRMPRTELPGTRMKKPQIVAGTSLHGEIVPLFCNLVMPGQIDSNIMNGAIWMSSPIAPIMSQIKASVNVFFVPLRLVWDYTKEFFGENKTTSGPQTTVYEIPSAYANGTSQPAVVVGSVSHYLGKSLKKSGQTTGTLVSVLKERAYWLVWSEYYRHQQVQNPVLLNKSGNGSGASIGTLDGNNITFSTMPAKCLKDFDYFTTATTSPNYGGEVLLPLGTLAPVITGDVNNDIAYANTYGGSTYGYVMKSGVTALRLATSVAGPTNGTIQTLGISSASNAAGKMTAEFDSVTGVGNDATVAPVNLYADLSKATAAKIDDLYTAMAAQAFYHNANYGSRYFELLQIHYGVSNPDLVLDRPEHISEFKFDIVVQDVVSSAGATNDSTTKLGQPGAYSKTLIRKRIYNHSFGEWGFVIALMNTYHQRYYSAGMPREDLYSELFDFYFPEFACRGDDSIYKGEIFANGTDTKGAFGYQEAYADRRYYPSRSTGQLDAYCDSNVNGKDPIGRWILDEKWTNAPVLGSQFLTEDRDALSEALVSGSNGPDFVWQFNFEHTEILPMPAYTKPGVPNFGRGII